MSGCVEWGRRDARRSSALLMSACTPRPSLYVTVVCHACVILLSETARRHFAELAVFRRAWDRAIVCIMGVQPRSTNPTILNGCAFLGVGTSAVGRPCCSPAAPTCSACDPASRQPAPPNALNASISLTMNYAARAVIFLLAHELTSLTSRESPNFSLCKSLEDPCHFFSNSYQLWVAQAWVTFFLAAARCRSSQVGVQVA
jgi:hypothetical protein